MSIDFPIEKKRRQRSMQIWSALGTSDGTGGAASADNRTVGGTPLEVGELPQSTLGNIPSRRLETTQTFKHDL